MQGASPEGRRTTSRTRRSILGASALAATALSGCLSSVSFLDRGDDSSSVDLPPGDAASFQKWIPADGVHGVEAFRAPWLFRPTRDGSEYLDEPVGYTRSLLESLVDYLGVGFDRCDRVLWTVESVAMEGPFDPDDVGETLVGSGYSAAGEYHEYDVYERRDTPRACVVRDGAAVWSRGARPGDRVRAHVDAEAGRAERLHEAVPAYDRLVEYLGERPSFSTFHQTGSQFLDGARVGATGYDVDDSGLYLFSVVVTEPDVDPSRSTLRERFSGAHADEELDAVDVTIDDDVVTMAARIPLDATHDTLGIGSAFPPRTTWGVDVESERYVLRHEAGESVRASRLELHDAEFDSHPVGFDSRDTVTPGDEFAFDRATVGDEFSLVWSAPGVDSDPLFEYDGS